MEAWTLEKFLQFKECNEKREEKEKQMEEIYEK